MGRLQQAAGPFAANKYPLLSAFFNQNPKWIWTYLKGVFDGKQPYPSYALDGKDGVYALRAKDNGGVIRISISGDWGTGTFEAAEVAKQMGEFLPDYTIHLGDVYYVGDDPEVEENFLGNRVPTSNFTPVTFPAGAVGTFTMLGNHEMYVGGGPYFTEMLGPNGPCDTGSGEKQKASFFCLETPEWRIIGLDTGYNSVGKPFLGTIPIIKKIPWVGANCALQREQLDWLSTNVKPQANRKPTLLLSHHQYYSVYEDAYSRPAEQLKDFFAGQDVVWIWGHEHRLSIYDNYSPDGNITCYGRCLGNGGMPVELETPGKDHPLLFLDPRGQEPGGNGPDRRYQVGDGTFSGWNGCLNLTLNGVMMTLVYVDLNGQTLLTESFQGNPDGSLVYRLLSNPVLQPPASVH
jgi:hypothetical protein